jgi:hypothetical protein
MPSLPQKFFLCFKWFYERIISSLFTYLNKLNAQIQGNLPSVYELNAGELILNLNMPECPVHERRIVMIKNVNVETW